MKLRRTLVFAVLALSGSMATAVDTDPAERVAADPDVAAARQAHDRGDL